MQTQPRPRQSQPQPQPPRRRRRRPRRRTHPGCRRRSCPRQRNFVKGRERGRYRLKSVVQSLGSSRARVLFDGSRYPRVSGYRGPTPPFPRAPPSVSHRPHSTLLLSAMLLLIRKMVFFNGINPQPRAPTTRRARQKNGRAIAVKRENNKRRSKGWGNKTETRWMWSLRSASFDVPAGRVASDGFNRGFGRGAGHGDVDQKLGGLEQFVHGFLREWGGVRNKREGQRQTKRAGVKRSGCRTKHAREKRKNVPLPPTLPRRGVALRAGQ